MSVSYLRIDGGEIAVEVDGDGPLIVCSPAMGDVREVFASLADQVVACGYRVARIDLRGHGDSSARFDQYGDEPTARDLLAVIDELGGGPAVLAGASLSAAASVIAAGRRPDKVAGLVLLGAFLRNGISAPMRWALQLALIRPWGPSVWRAQAAKLWPGLGEKAQDKAKATTELLTRPERWQAFRATVAGADHRVVAPWIERVRAPVLVVMGDADPDWKEPLREAHWIASNFADAEIIPVTGAGHAPMQERPEIVAGSVLRFLKRLRESGDLGRNDT